MVQDGFAVWSGSRRRCDSMNWDQTPSIAAPHTTQSSFCTRRVEARQFSMALGPAPAQTATLVHASWSEVSPCCAAASPEGVMTMNFRLRLRRPSYTTVVALHTTRCTRPTLRAEQTIDPSTQSSPSQPKSTHDTCVDQIPPALHLRAESQSRLAPHRSVPHAPAGEGGSSLGWRRRTGLDTQVHLVWITAVIILVPKIDSRS